LDVWEEEKKSELCMHWATRQKLVVGRNGRSVGKCRNWFNREENNEEVLSVCVSDLGCL